MGGWMEGGRMGEGGEWGGMEGEKGEGVVSGRDKGRGGTDTVMLDLLQDPYNKVSGWVDG